MPTTQPNLGYGQPTEATIDQVNQWMRIQPWYQNLLASWGQSPNSVNLSDTQKQQILRAAQAHGVVVDEGNMEVDDAGNFNPKGHKLRNTLIVAGIVGASIATMGAAGAFAGAASGGSAAAGGAAGTAGTLAGVEGGAYGLGSGTLAALGSGAMGAVPVASTLGAAGAAGAASVLPSTVIGTGEVGPIAGGTGLAGAGSTGAAGTLGRIGSALNRGNNVGDLISGAGQALGAAGQAQGQNRLNQEQLALAANGQNITGLSAYENELLNRAKFGEDTTMNRARFAESGTLTRAQMAEQAAMDRARLAETGEVDRSTMDLNQGKLEDQRRSEALKNIYRQSYATNPRTSPFAPASAKPSYSPEYLSTLGNLTKQGATQLATGPQFGTRRMTDMNLPTYQAPAAQQALPDVPTLPALTPYSPLDYNNLPHSQPGALESASNWLSPTLGTIGRIYNIYRATRG